jgi:hypothetical protein|nr:MAG TPA_asm: hypothetical protein [Caudoviricetes sp.]
METKINIAKILKNKPEGTKLWTDMFGSVTLYVVTDTCDAFQVKHHNKEPWFDEDGKLYKEGVLCIYPSKSMRDWEKFSWKKGDVLISDCGFMCIFKEWASDDYTKFNGCYFDGMPNTETAKYSKVDNNIAYGYIRDIENRCGGKLNLETLEIEKQTKFKDGDIVCISGIGYLAYGIVKNIDNSSKKLEYYVLNDMSTLKFEDWLSFEDKHILPITETQQIILFDALEKEGKAWDAEKKQIVDIKKEHQFKPFEKVLVRDSIDDVWRASFFSHIKENDGRYVTTCVTWKFCIPYIGNESLVGTTKDVEG